MRVADYIAEKLGKLGTTQIFMMYGGACADIVNGIALSDKTDYIPLFHEQAAGFAADAYSRVKGFGAAVATSGPGAHNLVTPIAGCFYDSIPAIFLTGQADQRFLRTKDEMSVRQIGFQESPIHEIIKEITKYSVRITDIKMARHEIEKAFYIATHGRPGPVLLDIPMDIQAAEINLSQSKAFDESEIEIKYDLNKVDQQIDSYLENLLKSNRPIGLIGGGIQLSGAIEELLEAQDILKIPMIPTWNALDIVTSDNPYFAGRVGVCPGKGRNFAIQNSDSMLLVGCRLSLRLSGGPEKFARAAKKYIVEIDPESLNTQRVVMDEKILCDAKYFLRRLKEKASKLSIPDFSEWKRKVFEWRGKYDPVSPQHYEANSNHGKVHPYAFMRLLSQAAGSDDIIIGDTGANVTILSQAFETKYGQRTFSNNGESSMGFSFPAAIGAWYACEKKTGQNVISIIGDGGMNINIQELQTLKNLKDKNQRVPIKTFIMNNHCLGFTLQFQERRFGRGDACNAEGKYIPPNFLKIARAYGLKGVRIEKNDSRRINQQLREILDSNEPVIVDVDNGNFFECAPRIIGNRPLEDSDPALPRKEFRENMIIEPLPGWKERKY